MWQAKPLLFCCYAFITYSKQCAECLLCVGRVWASPESMLHLKCLRAWSLRLSILLLLRLRRSFGAQKYTCRSRSVVACCKFNKKYLTYSARNGIGNIACHTNTSASVAEKWQNVEEILSNFSFPLCLSFYLQYFSKTDFWVFWILLVCMLARIFN